MSVDSTTVKTEVKKLRESKKQNELNQLKKSKKPTKTELKKLKESKKQTESTQVAVGAGQSKLEQNPNDILHKIFGLLSTRDGLPLYRVSKTVRDSLKNERFVFADGRRLELAIIMDATVSMLPHLKLVQERLMEILTRIQSHSDVLGDISKKALAENMHKYHLRLGWEEYRDYDIGIEQWTRLLNFTTDFEKIRKKILEAKAVSGSPTDWPEDVTGALNRALNEFHFTSNPHCLAKREILLILDAPPHGMGVTYGDNHPDGPPAGFPKTPCWLALAHAFKKKGITIHTVVCGTEEDLLLDLFATTISSITKGKCVRLNDAAQLADCIIAQICSELDLDKLILKKMAERESLELEGEEAVSKLKLELLNDMNLELQVANGVTEVTHPLTEKLSNCRTVDLARKLGFLKYPNGLKTEQTNSTLSQTTVSQSNVTATASGPSLLPNAAPNNLLHSASCAFERIPLQYTDAILHNTDAIKMHPKTQLGHSMSMAAPKLQKELDEMDELEEVNENSTSFLPRLSLQHTASGTAFYSDLSSKKKEEEDKQKATSTLEPIAQETEAEAAELVSPEAAVTSNALIQTPSAAPDFANLQVNDNDYSWLGLGSATQQQGTGALQLNDDLPVAPTLFSQPTTGFMFSSSLTPVVLTNTNNNVSLSTVAAVESTTTSASTSSSSASTSATTSITNTSSTSANTSASISASTSLVPLAVTSSVSQSLRLVRLSSAVSGPALEDRIRLLRSHSSAYSSSASGREGKDENKRRPENKQ